MTEKRPVIFVSYAHADTAALAGTIAERLTEQGAKVFINQQLRIGDDWNKKIEDALDACDAFCVLLSAEGVESPMVQNEIARVGDRRRREVARIMAEDRFALTVVGALALRAAEAARAPA